MKLIKLCRNKVTIVALVLAALIVSVAAPSVLLPQPALAQFTPSQQICQGSGSTDCTKGNDAVGKIIQTAVSVLLFAAGVASVIFIIYGGILYATSGGDSASIGKAKNTIIYAVVGLVVSFSAFALADFVEKLITQAK